MVRRPKSGNALADNLANASLKILRYILLQQGDTCAGGKRDVAVIWFDRSSQKIEECRFSSPIASEQTDALSRLDDAVDAVEQGGAAEADGQILERYERHGTENFDKR